MSVRPRGPQPDWTPTTERQRGILADVLTAYREHYDADTLPRGPRGIFYDLRPNGRGNGVTYRKPDSQHPIKTKTLPDGTVLPGFGPMEAHPDAVQEVLALARRAGMVPEWWVADGHATAPLAPSYDESADAVVRTVVGGVRNAATDFQLDPQRDQPIYVEVLCEASDLAPRLARIAGNFGVPVYSGGGFDGLKGKRAFASRALARDVPTVVLHVGDRDDHGDHIYVAAAEDANAWANDSGYIVPLDAAPTPAWLATVRDAYAAEQEPTPGLVFMRLALNAAQADGLGLLDSDGKAEADAVPVATMDRWLTDAIEALQLPAARDESLRQQERERGGIADAIRNALAVTESEDA